MKTSRRTPRYKRLLELLVERRVAAKLSQTELARRLEKPQSYVSKFESGERRLDIVELIDVTDAIGCSAKYFLEQLVAVRT